MWAGVTFESRAPSVASAPERADVAAFVGFARLRRDPAGLAPEPVRGLWRRLGWEEASTRDLPVLLESAADLAAWFDGWVSTAGGLRFEGYLVGAVRDFFRQGGLRCWLVSAGPPLEPPVDADGATAAVEALIPGPASGVDPRVRSTWRGLTDLLDLPEVALVAIPDLPACVGAGPSTLPSVPAEPLPRPAFTECATPPPEPPSARIHTIGPPRLGDPEWARWTAAIRSAVRWLQAYRPDVQLVAALPLGPAGSRAEVDPLPEHAARLLPIDAGGIGTAWLQLAWPWVEADTTVDRIGGVAPPDGVVAGLLARNALARGTFHPALDLAPHAVTRLAPRPTRQALWRAHPLGGGAAGEATLVERVSVIAATPHGYRLLSDVTTATDPAWRAGGVGRLVGVVRRAVERVGAVVVFAANGPATWRLVSESLVAALAGLRAAGGLHPVDAFSVRCGRDTMTEQDLDAGRLIATVSFRPVQAIARITVVLALANGSADVTVRGAT